MPSRNIIKTYIKGGIYHIYNRGVEKRTIFETDQDYTVFINYLAEYLSEPLDPFKSVKTFKTRGTFFKGIPRHCKNYKDQSYPDRVKIKVCTNSSANPAYN